MADDAFSIKDMEALYRDAFAPWVQALGIEVAEITDTGARFVLPENPDLSRDNGVVCGQAIAAVADTVAVLALAAKNGRYRQMTTVDMASNFMRPLMGGNVHADVTILSNGRRMATTRIDFWQKDPAKIGATATCVYAYLDG
ncbi:MAG: PaaI family thioesterase [Pseudomonadota bacterium]